MVTSTALQALNTGMFPNSLNHAHITLIPKKINPKVVRGYKPINLCDVLYKIVAKVFANKLKEILSQLISSTMSTFILGRLTHHIRQYPHSLCDDASLEHEETGQNLFHITQARHK